MKASGVSACRRRDVGDALWAEAAAQFSPAQLVEILSLVGFYHLVAFAVNATGVARERARPNSLAALKR